MGDTAIAADDWVRTVLGIDVSSKAPDAPGGKGGDAPGGKGRHRGKAVSAKKPDANSPISKAARDPKVWTESVGPALTRQGDYKTGARIKAPPTGPAQVCTGPTGREVKVVTGADGRVALTRDPPPITEITFSGGGGKGAALPGAIKALAGSGALKNVKQIAGASVGSMTAAMLAAGITPEGFQKLSDDTKFGPLIKGGDLIGVHVSGDGLEDLVRTGMGSSIQGQIARFASDAMEKGIKVDPASVKTLKQMSEKFSSGKGPTFKDLRVLSKIIPDIKEVTITGTMIGKASKKPNGDEGKMENTKPEMIVFSADTQPDVEVALAVHASAALPPVFKPVKIKLANGDMGKFEDGGVLNNAPTSDNLGTNRAVDPVPETGKMTFVFEDDTAHEMLAGKATPSRSRVNDFVAGAENSAADFGKNRGLADRPEDVVMVPLKFDAPKKTRPEGRGLLRRAADAVSDAAGAAAEGAKDLITHPINTILGGDKNDYSGLIKGTMNFDMDKGARTKLQDMTEQATAAHLAKRQEKETRSFASPEQMLACTTRDDLVSLQAGNYPGAKEALKFRDDVTGLVKDLEHLADGGAGASDAKVQAALKKINGLSKGDQERVGFIGRELNRSGKLDRILSGAKAGANVGGPDMDAVAAGIEVAAVLAAKKTGQRILKQVVYPKMVREGPKGPMGQLLAQMDEQLRDAKSNKEINRTLRIGITYFSKKFDAGGLLGHQDFADALAKNIQPED